MSDYVADLLETAGQDLKAAQKQIEDLRQMNDKCHELRLKFIDEQVKVIQEKDKEIETLRDDNQELENDLDDARNNLSWEKKEIETLRKWQTDMVAKLAEEHDLAGYRELGEKLAARDEEIASLREENFRLSGLNERTDKETYKARIAVLESDVEDLRSMVDKDSKSLRNRAIEIADLVTERDEWKRRFKFVVDLCMDDEWKQMVSKADPEFAGWLEEE